MPNFFITPEFLVIGTLIIGLSNLIIPFCSSEENTKLSNWLLINIAIFFFLSVLLIDYLFLASQLEVKIKLLSINHYQLALHLEALGLIFLTLLAFLWICAILYSISFLDVNGIGNKRSFLFFLNAAILMGSFTALAANLLTMFIGYELLTLCTIPLIIHQANKQAISGLYSYLRILMGASLILFLPAIILIYTNIGHGDFTPNGFIANYFSPFYAQIILLLFIFGIAKTAIYPLHSWLPAAMVASYPVSALLHAVVVVKTGLFCIYKILYYVFGLTYLQIMLANFNWLILLPIITIIYSSFKAVKCTKIKTILAYSTINQLSIALLAAFLFSSKGMIAAIMHMISHSFTKICIFYAAGNIYSIKNSSHINQLIGANKFAPKTSFIMLLAGLSLIGMPPFAGFFSKLYIMLAAAEANNLLAMLTLAISSLFSALYIVKMLVFIYKPTVKDKLLQIEYKPYFTKNRTSAPNIDNIETKLPNSMLISLFLCVSGVLAFFPIWQILNKFLIFI